MTFATSSNIGFSPPPMFQIQFGRGRRYTIYWTIFLGLFSLPFVLDLFIGPFFLAFLLTFFIFLFIRPFSWIFLPINEYIHHLWIFRVFPSLDSNDDGFLDSEEFLSEMSSNKMFSDSEEFLSRMSSNKMFSKSQSLKSNPKMFHMMEEKRYSVNIFKVCVKSNSRIERIFRL